MIAWRICKSRHPAFDGTGASLAGARWTSAGRPVIYASDCFAGSILEILAHAMRPRSLPGPHHAVRIAVPDDLPVEVLDPAELPTWEAPGSPAARTFGDAWFDERRTAVLIVPAVPGRPIARNLLINPLHPEATRPWDRPRVPGPLGRAALRALSALATGTGDLRGAIAALQPSGQRGVNPETAFVG